MTARIYILDSLNQSPVIIILYRKGSKTCQIGDLPRSGTLMSYCARRAVFINRVVAQLEEYLILEVIMTDKKVLSFMPIAGDTEISISIMELAFSGYLPSFFF